MIPILIERRNVDTEIGTQRERTPHEDKAIRAMFLKVKECQRLSANH